MPEGGILLASDLSARSDRALARATTLARQWLAPLVALHVVDDDLPEEIAAYQQIHAETILRRQLLKEAGDGNSPTEVRVLRGMDFKVINATAEAMRARLMVIGSHREDVLKDVFIGTTAERVLRYSRRPVLVAKQPVLRDYRRILVGVDFSPTSRRALELARAWWPRAEMTALHVMDPPFRAAVGSSPQVGADYDLATSNEARDDLEAALLRWGLTGVQPHVEIGEPKAVFASLVRRHDLDLVVVGTHGRSGFAHLLLGSFAEAILGHLATDVLAVAPAAEATDALDSDPPSR